MARTNGSAARKKAGNERDSGTVCSPKAAGSTTGRIYACSWQGMGGSGWHSIQSDSTRASSVWREWPIPSGIRHESPEIKIIENTLLPARVDRWSPPSPENRSQRGRPLPCPAPQRQRNRILQFRSRARNRLDPSATSRRLGCRASACAARRVQSGHRQRMGRSPWQSAESSRPPCPSLYGDPISTAPASG